MEQSVRKYLYLWKAYLRWKRIRKEYWQLQTYICYPKLIAQINLYFYFCTFKLYEPFDNVLNLQSKNVSTLPLNVFIFLVCVWRAYIFIYLMFYIWQICLRYYLTAMYSRKKRETFWILTIKPFVINTESFKTNQSWKNNA